MAVEQNEKPRTVVFDKDDIKNEEGIENETLVDTNHKWESLNLKSNLVKGIYSVGFENPSFIQKKAIPIIAEGNDLRAQAQSGTGKTGAFVIGSLQKIDELSQTTQVLILASTREIAAQNAAKFVEIGTFMKVSVCLLAGGTPVQADRDLLAKNPQIIVGTPGRINHMMEKGYLNTTQIKIFILDEADEMLKAGFEEQVRQIFCEIKSPVFQTLLFSATYSEEDLNIIKNMVENPIEIDLRYEDQTLKGIKQFYVDIGPSCVKGNSPAAREQELLVKVHTLIDIFKNQVLSQVMIFINRKSHASIVHQTLNEHGFPCELISSDFEQSERVQTLENFKSGKTRILVSSGLCKRGIDVQALSVVVCLDVPRFEEKNDYIHRVGRSGRYGRKGIALHILTSYELETLVKICENFNSVITPLPTGFSFKD
ncbi:uncharacterized protein LOC143921983 [Arctopsyche grandis]|uniref:uncharacterized protein LOC143921983 n=1 Tax=Arctopsyche grandis TaxID=121162 RepID=UPI00406D72D6